MKHIYLFLILLIVSRSVAQDSLKKYAATRITQAPKMDGVLDDEAWKEISVAADFLQNTPSEGKKATYPTEVKIVYDNIAVYVGVMMYDSLPNKILHELGNRDAGDLNADYFRFVVDPYNTRQDAYDFGVYASGVQTDAKFSDGTYDAVWESAVKINDKGWCVEMRIPYSAIRFPKKNIQEWALQITRTVRRTREFDQWALTPSGKANPLRYWGTLNGIENVEPPLRLSLTPYLSAYSERAPEYNPDNSYSYSNSFLYKGGADIKYGIDERFTLDMTLLPDFGQVQSDNKVKNLSYRETTFEENRPFFKEGTELFNKNRLFYSRRIGKTPGLFYSVPYLLNADEKIIENPSQVKLLNATKLSGRTDHGTGIGVLNAVTENTYALVKDTLTGTSRKILTEPLTNFNVVVIDQQLKNASNIYFINTNVVRKDVTEKDAAGNNLKTYNGDANVSAMGYALINKKSTWQTDGNFVLSQKYMRDTIPYNYNAVMGYSYFVGIQKISGNWIGGLGHEVLNNTFDRSDMGYQSINNFEATNLFINYNLYKPWKKIRASYNGINAQYSNNFLTKERTNLSINLDLYFQNLKYFSWFGGGGTSPYKSHDYYEPRVSGKYYLTRRYYFLYAGISTDYRKKVALDFKTNMAQYIHEGIDGIYYQVEPGLRFRLNDHLSVFYNGSAGYDKYNEGFANFDTLGNIIFGGRELYTYENKVTAKYIFKNDMSLSLVARHYWSTGHYVKYFNLQDDGTLLENQNYVVNNDFSYNAFNVDIVYSWQFHPGSQLLLVYKNAIETQDNIIASRFTRNFNNTIDSPQTNSISLKLLYYLDYQSLRKKRTS